MKKIGGYSVALVAVVVLVNILAHCLVVRWDLTDDHRYSLSEPTQSLLTELDQPLYVTTYLDGELNSGFRRLKNTSEELLAEMGHYATLHTRQGEGTSRQDLQPVVIHERTQNGKTAQTTLYPYMEFAYGTRRLTVSLLHNQRGLSGEENLNRSLENMEYLFAEAIHSLKQDTLSAIAFLEGHGELSEHYVLSAEQQLGRYFRVDRGAIGHDPSLLDQYRCLIIADPGKPFSEVDRYALDRYLMRGGRILWLINGVQFSTDVLSNEGFTPVIPLELNLQDMLFQYGVRINPVLVQDQQCLPIPVNVAAPDQQPNYQPIPWYYAPLLLTSEGSPITRNLGQISSTFVSTVSAVGADEAIRKNILLATSSASRLIGTPAEVDLSDLNPDPQDFRYGFIPVAMSLEGVFPSVFRHLEVPEEITTVSDRYQQSVPTRQIVVASGSVIRNEWQQGQALPLGYDRYSGMQFSNPDFITHAVLWLTDDEGLISLRQKQISLRLINDRRAHDHLPAIRLAACGTPLLVLLIVGLIYILIRKRRYTV